MSKTISKRICMLSAVCIALTMIILSAVYVHADSRYILDLEGEVFKGRTEEVAVTDTKNDVPMDVISASSSDTSVLNVTTKTRKIDGQSVKVVYVTGKKVGMATLSVNFKNASGKKATLKEEVPVIPYPAWVDTFTVDGKKVDVKKNKYEYSQDAGGNTVKIKVVPAKGHPISFIEAYVNNDKTGSSKEIKVTKAMLKKGAKIKFPEKYDSLDIYLSVYTFFDYESDDEVYSNETILDYHINIRRPGKYKLTYVMNGGTNSPDNPARYKGKIRLKNPKARKGYDFKGWYSDKKFRHKVKTVKNKSMTLYAKWDWHAYTIKFVKNGGKGSQYYQRCRYGKSFNLPACKYKRSGYTFAGWNTKKDGSGKAYADKASVGNLTAKDNKTIRLYAQWKIKKYKIKYKGVPDGSKNPNRKTYTVKTSTFKLKDASNEGYAFKGWYSDSKKTKKITSVKKGGTGTKTIYSKWTPHKYVIVFNANGGKGTMASMTSRKYGTSYTLTKNSFKKNDYVFDCWNTQADGKGKKYKDGAKVKNLTPTHGGKITLYAQWKPAFKPRTQLKGIDSGCMTRSLELLGVDMPNCTTYALARALEITKYNYKKSPKYVPPFIVGGHSNAEYWMENNRKSKKPYPTGKTPKVGAIAVWSGNMGHVAIVEAIDSKGVVYYSHSSYNGLSYKPVHPYKGSVNNSYFHCEAFTTQEEINKYIGSSRKLLGYIYLID